MKPASARFPVSAIEPVEADPLLDLGALRPRAPVVPEDRGAQDVAARVEGDEAVHLAGEPDRGRLDAQVGERRLRRAPPVLRILLRPSRSRRRERVAALGEGDDFAFARDRDGLGGGRPDVETDEDRLVSHGAPRAVPGSGAGCCSIRNGRRPSARSPMRRPTTSSSSTRSCSRRMRSTTSSAASASRSPCSSRSTTTHAAPGRLVRRHGARVLAARRARAAVERRAGTVETFAPGEEPVPGVRALPTARSSEGLYWLGEHRALVPGDVILGAGEGPGLRLCPESWLPGKVKRRPRRVPPSRPRASRGARARLARRPGPCAAGTPRSRPSSRCASTGSRTGCGAGRVCTRTGRRPTTGRRRSAVSTSRRPTPSSSSTPSSRPRTATGSSRRSTGTSSGPAGPVRILLTVEWHARSADELASRYGAVVGGDAPAGVEAFAVPPVDETLWILSDHAALVAGDVLLGADGGGVRLCPDSWLEGRSTPTRSARSCARCSSWSSSACSSATASRR